VTCWLLAGLLAAGAVPSPAAASGDPEAGAVVDAPGSRSAASPERRKLEEILARREFRAARRDSGLELLALEPPALLRWLGRELGETLGRFFDWLRELFRRERRDVSDDGSWVGAGAGPLTWLLLALLATLLGLVAWRAVRRREPPPGVEHRGAAAPAERALPDALARPADAWARFAEQFAGRGQWRLALRALYLELLATLHQRRAIRYERQRTNGDYVAMLRGHPASDAFGRLSAAFDLAWYGNKPFGASDYDAALGLAREVARLAPPAAAP
jgi:hypothetical protein